MPSIPPITVLPLTSELIDAPLLRVSVEPGESTGLRLRSQVMVDKATTIPRVKVGNRIGQVDTATLRRVSQVLAAFLTLNEGPATAKLCLLAHPFHQPTDREIPG